MTTARSRRRRTATFSALALATALLAAPASAQAPGDPVGLQVATGPGAQFLGSAAYAPPVVPLPQGVGLTYTNADVARHNVCARDAGPDGEPLFCSPLIGVGQSVAVDGVEALEPADYAFYCTLHPNMTGTLSVVENPAGGGDPDPDPDPDPEPVDADWPLFGRDLANSRHTTSGPDAAGLLTYQEDWHHSTGGNGDFAGTPVVAQDKVFMGSVVGDVVALDRDSGEVAWQVGLTTGEETAAITATLAYHEGVVYVPVSAQQGQDSTPYVVALRAGDGAELWRTYVDDEQSLGDLYGSPVVWETTIEEEGEQVPFTALFIGTSSWTSSGSAADEMHLGSVVALDVGNGGELLWRTYMFEGGPQTKDAVPSSEDTGKPYDGAAVWSTPTVDTEDGMLYAGTGNGYESTHALVDSIVKLDAFTGELVDHYSATETDPWQATSPQTGVDADFGASPQLIDGPDGERWVGTGQKNSHLVEDVTGDPALSAMVGLARYHMVDRETMEPVWVTPVGPGHFWGGITGATAYDGERIYGGTVWGQLFALDKADGSVAWMTSSQDAVVHMAHTQVANGVVYSADGKGNVGGWDAATGAPLWTRSMTLTTLLGGSPSVGPSAAGVAVSGDTIYTAYGMAGAGGSIHAYRP